MLGTCAGDAVIKMQLTNNPGYPTRNPNYLGTIHHSEHGVAASVNSDYKSTWPVRRYLCGLEDANYPMPAIRNDIEIFPDRVILFTKHGTHWDMRYLALMTGR